MMKHKLLYLMSGAHDFILHAITYSILSVYYDKIIKLYNVVLSGLIVDLNYI